MIEETIWYLIIPKYACNISVEFVVVESWSFYTKSRSKPVNNKCILIAPILTLRTGSISYIRKDWQFYYVVTKF